MDAVMYPGAFKNQSSLTDAEISRIQVYISREGGSFSQTLEMSITDYDYKQSKEITDGRGTITNTTISQTDLIKITNETPGVIVHRGYDWVDVDFGAGLILTFKEAQKSWLTRYLLWSATKDGRPLRINNYTGTTWYLRSDEDISTSNKEIHRTKEIQVPGKTVK